MYKYALLVIMLCFPSVVFASLDKVSSSVCKVITDDGYRGTGVVIHYDLGEYFILTAGHIAQRNIKAVSFFHSGFESDEIPAKTLWFKYKVGTPTDLGLIKVKVEDIKDYPKPNVVPLAKPDAELHPGQIVLNYGIPRGVWPVGWIGHIEYIGIGKFITMIEHIPGQSGSGIFDKDGKTVLGIVILQNGTNVHIKTIYDLLSNTQYKSVLRG